MSCRMPVALAALAEYPPDAPPAGRARDFGGSATRAMRCRVWPLARETV
eukprot:CAMPEP_0172668942 /NCGR_PEP_ID=MMETSP1074-20121228/9373_1 /TAXON_ID=2916 /ORGANISM="Ceratium fusus, Strain PA161109" /LENGTH=48 /DNA_ID= /DNA_START= /DNA_END= /DNA_ORIENTATION=